MPDTDPVTVNLTADPSDLVTGLNEGSNAMRRFGSSADDMGVRIEGASRNSKTLFRGLLEMRIAMTSTEHVLKMFGIQNETVAGAMQFLSGMMDVAITAMAIYRAASFLTANADLAKAGAAFLAGIGEVSAATLFLGTAAAIGATFAAYEAYRVFTGQGLGIPGLAVGGVVLPRSGGTQVTLGEGGEAEAVVPLSKASQMGFGNGIGSHITMNIYSNDPDYIGRQLARFIERQKAAGY